MASPSQNFKIKLLAAIFSIVFILIAIMISLTFLVQKPEIQTKSKIYNESIEDVWTVIKDRTYYLESKKEIQNFYFQDTILPSWVEYYTKNDSVENITKTMIEKKKFTYITINRKYQQINGLSYRLDSIDKNKTNLTCYELSRYFNIWASIYFQLFYPNTVLDYEFIKINNSLEYLHSKNRP